MPPLRGRKEDIPLLVDLFIKKFAAREGKTITGITREALAVLLHQPFPGNVRELENIVERAVVFAEGDAVGLADLPVFLAEAGTADPGAGGTALTDKVRRLEVQEIRLALRASAGIKSRAARALGITERMLAYKMKAYGLDGEGGPKPGPGGSSRS